MRGHHQLSPCGQAAGIGMRARWYKITTMSPHTKGCRSRILILAGLAASVAIAPAALGEVIGRVVGHVDGVRFDVNGAHVWGWVCQQGRSESIAVHIYAEPSASDASKGTLVVVGKADRANEPAVNQACRDGSGHKHRFDVPIPTASLAAVQGQKIYVHGIRIANGVPNDAIAASGTLAFPAPPPLRDAPASYPPLAGVYRASPEHPRVFVSRGELADMARRTNTEGSFSARRFATLADWVKHELAANLDWDAAYSGCDLEVYLRGFAFELKPAYGNDRSDDELRAAMHGKAGTLPLHGAAMVAARLALYAALVTAGAVPPPGAPSPEQAAVLAKRILVAWADRGFRNEHGAFRGGAAQYCDLDISGKPMVTQLGTFVGALTLSRGVIYSVHGQDLLQGMGALSADEGARLDGFHRHMADAIRVISNEEFDRNMKWRYSDEAYNNQNASHLTSLLAIARLTDDKVMFAAVLNGGGGAVKLPWTVLFDHLIYGPADRPLLHITPNNDIDPSSSHPAYSTAMVAAGEINDRYRNSNPSQGVGYPMGSLQSIYMQAELLTLAGYDSYSYRGAHGQSIEMASDYYACFAKTAGFRKTITAESSQACPDAQEYVGRVVNGVDTNVVIGAYRFFNDGALTALDAAAKTSASSGPFSLEPILYGKWRE